MIINNRDYLKKMIINEDRHLFIYGYEGDKRSNLLKEIALESQDKFDGKSPIGVYIYDDGLPEIKVKVEDMIPLKILARDYYSYLICDEILKAVLNTKIENLDEFTYYINKCFLKEKASSIEEISYMLNKSKDICYREFINYINNGEISGILFEAPFEFMFTVHFVTYLKRNLNMNSYFALLFDVPDDLSIISQKAINDYVGCRNNADISMKVATNNEVWKTLYDLNGNMVQSVHDFGYVEIDNNLNDNMKKIKRKI